MNENARKDENGRLREAEIKRIESERAKNAAEERKLSLEADQVQRRLRHKWYSPVVVAKWGVAGFVAGVLFVVWMVGFFQPILKKEQRIAQLDNQWLTKENRRQAEENALESQRNRRDQQALIGELEAIYAQNDTLNHQLTQSVERAEEQKTLLNKLSDQLNELAAKEILTETERSVYARQAREVDNQIEGVEKEIDDLNVAQTAAEERSQRVSQRLEIRGKSIMVFCETARDPNAMEIKRRLTGLGAKVLLAPLISGVLPVDEKVPGVVYTRETNRGVAALVAGALEDIKKFKLVFNEQAGLASEFLSRITGSETPDQPDVYVWLPEDQSRSAERQR